MERCEHYTLNCEQEKMGCEGCAYNKKSADEMFEELGYEKEIVANGVEYYLGDGVNEKEIDFLENAAGEMEKRIWIDDFHFITLQELKAINKKVEELGWK